MGPIWARLGPVYPVLGQIFKNWLLSLALYSSNDSVEPSFVKIGYLLDFGRLGPIWARLGPVYPVLGRIFKNLGLSWITYSSNDSVEPSFFKIGKLLDFVPFGPDWAQFSLFSGLVGSLSMT